MNRFGWANTDQILGAQYPGQSGPMVVGHSGSIDQNVPYYSPMQYNALKDQMTQYAVFAGLGGLAAGALGAWFFSKKR
jgi:hypothetical protein